MIEYINNALRSLKDKHRIPFHMPGHKRKMMTGDPSTAAYEMDITEITDYDNLHHPEGIIRSSMDELKKIYGSRESWYVINGSTAGILSSIASVCDVGDTIVIGRNCHKSVYNMIKLLHLIPIYIYPEYNEKYHILSDYKSEEIKRLEYILKEHKETKAVFITSPTYEGVISDISTISELVHRYGLPLIVDEAHGAHLPFCREFPESAVMEGADLVIQSAHKTLPAVTQTALLHLCSDRVDVNRVFDALSVFETSSPSYLMMASIEKAVAFMENNPQRIEKYTQLIHNFRRKCAQMSQIHLISREDVDCYAYDIGKLVISVANTFIDGNELFHILLDEYGIECEMANDAYCIAMTSVCDGEDDFDKLYQALFEIDQKLAGSTDRSRGDTFAQKVIRTGGTFASKEMPVADTIGSLIKKEISTSDTFASKEMPEGEKTFSGNVFGTSPERFCEMWECNKSKRCLIPLSEAEGRIAAEFIQLYPPDIPLLVPGEKIQKEMVENIASYIYNGYNVLGMFSGQIFVLEEEE